MSQCPVSFCLFLNFMYAVLRLLPIWELSNMSVWSAGVTVLLPRPDLFHSMPYVKRVLGGASQVIAMCTILARHCLIVVPSHMCLLGRKDFGTPPQRIILDMVKVMDHAVANGKVGVIRTQSSLLPSELPGVENQGYGC